ncbi:MAG: lipopolysaccharide heptosyltransferase II [Chloroflexi bacterium]|nr:lipopolysaccharide heptosyltransferase II [Chloroflexota bacterium]
MIDTRWQTAKNILCIRLDSIGDVLMTTPAMRALKTSAKGRRITLLTSASGAQVAHLVPEIDDVIVYDAPWLKSTAPRANSTPDLKMIERLRGYGFDGALIFTVFSQNPLPSAMMCYLADIPLRLAHCHENAYQLLTNWVVDKEPAHGIRHEVQRQLDLVAAIGARTDNARLSLRLTRAAHEHALRVLADIGLDIQHPWIAIHPGATAASRRYSPEGYGRVAHQLVSTRGAQVVFTGATNEIDLIERIQNQAGVKTFSLGGKLELVQLAAVIELAPVLITNNTGPAHIAAAVGTPVVDLYALTNPQHTPWGVPHRVLSHDVPCKYCFRSICPEGHHNCLELVTPDQVVRAVDELWNAHAEFLIRQTISEPIQEFE